MWKGNREQGQSLHLQGACRRAFLCSYYHEPWLSEVETALFKTLLVALNDVKAKQELCRLPLMRMLASTRDHWGDASSLLRFAVTSFSRQIS